MGLLFLMLYDRFGTIRDTGIDLVCALWQSIFRPLQIDFLNFDAVGKGALTGQKVGGCIVVVVNKKFEAWGPMKVRQAAGKSRWAK